METGMTGIGGTDDYRSVERRDDVLVFTILHREWSAGLSNSAIRQDRPFESGK